MDNNFNPQPLNNPMGGNPSNMQQGAPQGPPPENNLVWAILSTVLCCLPLGVVAIIKSTQVNTKWQMGDIAGAQKSAKDAKKFAMWSAILAGIFWILYIVFFLVIGLSGSALSILGQM